MAEGQDDQEKTEAPTERRREELRREGQFAYSREVPGTIIFGGLLLSLYMFGSFLLSSIAAMFQKSFSNFALGDFSGPSVSAVLQFISLDFLFWVAILLLFLFVLGLAAGIGQIGLHWSAKSIMPDLLKINPLTGFGRIFSINNLMESIKILLKVILVGYVCYSVIASDLINILHYSLQDKDLYLFNLWKILETLLFKLFLSFLLLASLDYLWQRISFERRIRMSRQELKEEMRQSEGDPLIKARIRQIQQKMSRARMLQEVPKADLVLANPTHYAVVIKYEPGVMAAPQVVAKGLDYLALRIIEIAQKAGVVVSREPALARSLYGALEIGDAIPEEYYALVAEVLAKAYKIKGRKLAS